MPIGAFTASEDLMSLLQDNPKLGHITTFGGHPVIAASAFATLKEITSSNLMQQALKKEKLIRALLVHPFIKEIRGKGLMLALITPSEAITTSLILKAQNNGLLLFWLLFEPKAVRITPPLTISNEEITKGCHIILNILNSIDEK
jgi:acetylornithine/succinyldiaminopimelate/putrescine aminotransferase